MFCRWVADVPAFRSVTNKIGARPTLLLGSTGYALYIGSFLYVFEAPGSGVSMSLTTFPEL